MVPQKTTIILILLAIISLLIIWYTCKSSFGAEVSKSTDASSKIDSITPDTVLIFFAPWCGHCKSSMGDFKKAVESSNGKVMMINSDDTDPKVKDLMKKNNIKGFPTIKKADGTEFKGPRTADAIQKFSE